MDDEIKKEEEIDEENIIEDYIDLNSGGYGYWGQPLFIIK